MFSKEELTGEETTTPEQETSEFLCSLPNHALIGASTETKGVIQLHSYIADHEMMLLVDSGSSTSFINKQLASKLLKEICPRGQ